MNAKAPADIPSSYRSLLQKIEILATISNDAAGFVQN